MMHPADETHRQIFYHGYLPVLIAVFLLILSVIIDLCCPGLHMTQRAGTTIIVLGAYVGYVDVKRNIKIIEGALFINPELPYRPISIILIVFGTFISGYADLIL